jgi:hypothetical protein
VSVLRVRVGGLVVREELLERRGGVGVGGEVGADFLWGRRARGGRGKDRYETLLFRAERECRVNVDEAGTRGENGNRDCSSGDETHERAATSAITLQFPDLSPHSPQCSPSGHSAQR